MLSSPKMGGCHFVPPVRLKDDDVPLDNVGSFNNVDSSYNDIAVVYDTSFDSSKIGAASENDVSLEDGNSSKNDVSFENVV